MKKGFGLRLLLPLLLLLTLLTATAQAFDVSGTVNYAGSKTGRVFLTLWTNNGPLGTSIVSPGAFTIRGAPAGTYMVTAFMDALDTGSRHASDPSGVFSPVTITSASVSGVNISLTDPAPLSVVQPPTGLRVFPGDASALVQWDFVDTGNGSDADSYSVYWDTNPSLTPANAAFNKLDIPAAGDRTDLLLSGMANGNYYFVMTAKSGAVVSSPSAPVGPVAIGPQTGGFSVSGAVTFPAVTSAGPLYIAIGDFSSNGPPLHMYPTYINSPVSPQAFTVNGVPNGTYRVYAVVDVNNNGLIDIGDYKTNDRDAAVITVNNGAVTNANPVISAAGSLAEVRTNHYLDGGGETYGLDFQVNDGYKRPVTVTLSNGPNVTGPIDIGLQSWGGFYSSVNIGSVVPAVNDTYTFDVGYSDGSSEANGIKGQVSGVVSAFATPTAPVGTVSYSATPTFTWSAPASLPANGSYALKLFGNSSSQFWDSSPIAFGQTSALFNFDGSASQASLADGTNYNWSINIYDQLGNSSSNWTGFNFPVAGGILPASLPGAVTGIFYFQQLTASGGNGSYFWSIATGTLPPGLTLSSNGFIGGTPTVPGSYTFTVQVSDTGFPQFTTNRTYTLTVASGTSTLIVNTGLPTANQFSAYDQPLSVSGGIPPYNWTIVGGSLPPGMTFDAARAAVTGTPTTSGNFSFAVQVSDSSLPAQTAIQTLNIFVAPANIPASISGTVSYSGSQTGRIYITLQSNNGRLGTSIAAPGPYTIRGVPPGNYTVTAFMDSLNLGVQVQTSPNGSAFVNLSGSDVTGVTIPLTDPTPITPAAVTNVSASASDSSVIIGWDPPRVNGIESADAYDIYYGPTASVSKTNNSGSRLNVPAGMDSPTIVDGLVNGSSLFFVAVPKSGGIEGPQSLAIGPFTIGAPTGGNTVSGTVNYSGPTPTGPLYVAVVNPMSKGAAGVYYTRIVNPGPVNNFSVSGVPNGDFIIYTIFDMNNDKQFGTGDVMSNDQNAKFITVSGAGLSGVSITLVGQNAEPFVTTAHGKPATGSGEWYNVEGGIRSQLKRPVIVTLIGAPTALQPVLPLDIGIDNHGGEFRFWSGNTGRPSVGDTYTFAVTYADGSVESAVMATVTGVNDSFPTNPQISSPTTTVPTFSWGAPLNPPASFRYDIWVNGNNGDVWDSWELPSSMTSIVYGSTGDQPQPLQLNSQYNWTLSVRDQNGNSAAVNSSFTPTVAAPVPVAASMTFGGVYHLTKADGSQWDVLDLGTTSTATTLGTMTATVSGPNGFSYTFTDLDKSPYLNGQLTFNKQFPSTSPLAAGVYTFTLDDGLGHVSSRVDSHVSALPALPIVDSTTIQLQRKADNSYRVSWAPVNATTTYNYRVRIQKADGSGIPVYLGSRTNAGFENIPSNLLTDGIAYQLRIEVTDAPSFDLQFNRSNSNFVNFTPLAVDYDVNRLLFNYTSVYNRFEADGSQLYSFGFGFGNSADALKVTSSYVTGPNGFRYDFQPADLLQPNGVDFTKNDAFVAAPPQPGLYTFHVQANGLDHVAYNTLTPAVNYALPDVTTYQGEDLNNGNIRFSWADVNHNGDLYYRVFIQDTVTGQYITSARVNQAFVDMPKTALGDLTTKKGRVEVYDSSSGITIRNRVNGPFTAAPFVVQPFDATRPVIGGFGIMNDILANGTSVTHIWLGGTDSDGTITELRVDGPNGYTRNLLTQGKADGALYRLIESGSPQAGLYTFTVKDNAGNTAVRYNYQPVAHAIPSVDFRSVKITNEPNGDARISWAPVQSDVPLWYILNFSTNTDADNNGWPDPLAISASQIGQFVTQSSVVVPAASRSLLNLSMFRISAYDGGNFTTYNTRSRSAYAGYQGAGYNYAALTDADGDGFASNVDANDNNAAVFPFAPAIDATPPVTTASPAGGTYGASQSVTLTASEPATIYFTTDGSLPTTASAVYSAPIAITASATLKFFARDAAGNSEAVRTEVYAIDTTLPVTTASPAGGTYGTAQTVTLTASEAATIYYTLDGSTPTTTATVYTTPLVISASTTLKFFARDTIGNSEAVKTATYVIDTTTPVTSASPVGALYNAAQTVILTANKTGVTIYYTTDGSNPTTASAVYTAPLSIAATTTLKFFGKDLAGNSEVIRTEVYTIDTTLPVTTASPVGGTYGSAQTVTLTASETATIYFTTDGSTPTTASTVYTTPLLISANTTLKFFARDAAGNSESVRIATYVIDTSIPVTTASPAGGLYNSVQTVTLSANKSGATIYYTLNGTEPTTASAVYTAPLTIAASTTLKFFAKDATGNSEGVKTEVYTLDTLAPTIVASTPANNAANVAVTTVLSIKFSEPVKTATLGNIVVRSGLTVLNGSSSYDATTNTATFTPATPLAMGTTFTVSLSNGIEDLAGNKLAPQTLTFTTELPNGDLDGSGLVDLVDALRALEIAVGRVQATPEELRRADVAPLVSGKPAPDGIIDVADVVILLRRSVNLVKW